MQRGKIGSRSAKRSRNLSKKRNVTLTVNEETHKGTPSRGARGGHALAKPKPQPAELEFDDDARAAEAETLRELMADEELRHTVGTTLGEDQLDSLHRTFDALTDADPTPIAIGRVIELVIQSYGAPHLRPTSIRARARDGKIRESSMSLRALMRYIAGELRNEC